MSTVFWTIFAILGMALFMGKFYRCNDPLVVKRSECVGTMENGEMRVWNNAQSHFDDFFHSMMTLLELATTEGWVEVMLNGMDVTSRKQKDMKKIPYILCSLS